MDENVSVKQLIARKNNQKKLFTAGPASLASANLVGLEPCFGRGDNSYDCIEERVLTNLKKMSGHMCVARMQGSGSMALEVMVSNFAYGKVLVVNTGYYAARAKMMAEVSSNLYGFISAVDIVNWDKLHEVSCGYDWVIACYTETSIGLKLDMHELRKKSDSLGARLMLDATASIGLESDHDLADAISYSSCKGLFGLTGGAFIAFNESPSNELDSFNMSIESHLSKKMTGPYHAICSLDLILQKHDSFRAAVLKVKTNFLKKFESNIFYPLELQPNLCTRVMGTIESDDTRAVLYTPRTLKANESVVCHLGEVHLGNEASGHINDCLKIS